MYTKHTIINIGKKITRNYPNYNNVCSYGIFLLGTKNELEIAVVNEQSVFEPLKVDCIAFSLNEKCVYVKFEHMNKVVFGLPWVLS